MLDQYKSAVLRLGSGALWHFLTPEGGLSVEESLWVAPDGRPVDSLQLVISGQVEPGGASLGWLLKHMG